jgi:hypothetical protein
LGDGYEFSSDVERARVTAVPRDPRGQKPEGVRANVLIAIAPQLYREAIANAVRSQRPDVIEVGVCPPEDLDWELTLSQPELLVCHDTAPEARELVHNRIEIYCGDSLEATVFREGDRTTKVANIGLRRLLTVLDLIAISE